MQFQADIYQQDKKERRTFRWPAWGSVTVGLIAALSTGRAIVNYMPAQATSVLTQVTEPRVEPTPTVVSQQLTDEQRNLLLTQKQSNLA
ncbi:general secretion pathway protein GspA, partial [Vibrio parahaemolyticus]|nr:general secretion pathway protein GspA [Vibrio parahaemolyticus]